MKSAVLGALMLAAVSPLVAAQTLLLGDNFDAPDTNNFDGALLTGRLSGTLAGDVQLRSSRIQQDIAGMQLSMLKPASGSGRIRFHQQANLANWHDWASGTGGTAILNAGGFRVEFDWVPGTNTSGDWVSFCVGIDGQAVAEPGIRVNHAGTDIGILFRDNGATERFDNGVNRSAGGSFPATLTTRRVLIEYSFTSFADGSLVDVVATVDGVEVINESWDWAGNGGTMFMEFGNLAAGTLIDNFEISTLPSYVIDLAAGTFGSWLPQGGLVGTLSAILADAPAPSSFSLVAGDGDTDNGKFQINGDRLEIGSYDFTNANSTDGQEFSVRVRGDSNGSADFQEREFLLTITVDDDQDDLIDDWEKMWTGNITDLNGNGVADFDNDTLTDLEEYQFSLGAYPLIDPTSADSDGDTLSDDGELAGVGLRLPTAPDRADTDSDGLSDLVETNTGFFTDANDTGTDPTAADWDQDGSRDGWELANGGDMYDAASFPPSASPSVTAVRLTGDATSGISSAKTYTHVISGSGPATVNGVAFDILSPTVTPANFTWDTLGNTKNEILLTAANHNGDWQPAVAGVSGPGLTDLLGAFTYSGTGAAPGSSQRFTLSGLTPGEDYELRLYIRIWSFTTVRPIDLVFTNGAEVVEPFGALPEDRPGNVLGTFEDQHAYYLNFSYTAQGTELTIDATVGAGGNGSFHMYGLTNEVASAGEFAFTLDNDTFNSWNAQGTLIGNLEGFLDGVADPSSFTLVAGAGDTDNGKFQITGGRLEVGSYDFTGANSSSAEQFSVRIRGTGNSGGVEEREFVLTIFKDDDQDVLEDGWELMWAADLTVLDGNGVADADGDSLTDLDEYELSRGLFQFFPTPFPLIDPTTVDTDGDGLDDGEEIFPTAIFRLPTDPTKVDTDDDGLSDFVETGTFTFVDENNTGTDATLYDSDGDGAGDGDEIEGGSDPFDAFDVPLVFGSFALVELTDDASAGIDPSRDYTHAISGGGAATVNGVLFETLNAATIPANFGWDTGGLAMSVVAPINPGDWNRTTGGLTGIGLYDLFGGFTYSGDGANPGSTQTFTLSGLTPGSSYEARVYIRIWDTGGSGRPIDLSFTNGSEVDYPRRPLLADRPGDVLGTGNPHTAYYISYIYTAQTGELVITARVPDGAPAASGSFHMYGLSNELTTAGPGGVTITGITRVATGPNAGGILLQYSGAPDTTYDVTKSVDGIAFVPLDMPLSSTSDGAGLGQVVVPASEVDPAAAPVELYRLEEQ